MSDPLLWLLALQGLLVAVLCLRRPPSGADAAGRGMAVAYAVVGLAVAAVYLGGTAWLALAGIRWLAWTLALVPFAPILLPLRDLGKPPLVKAVRRGELDSFRRLLEAGADAKRPGLLRLAAAWPVEMTTLLLQHGADPNAADQPLFRALEDDQRSDVAHALLAAGADANARNRKGQTPALAYAARRRPRTQPNWELLMTLLDHGADPKASTPDGATLESLIRTLHRGYGNPPMGYTKLLQRLK